MLASTAFMPRGVVPVAEVAGRRAAGVVDEDVGRRARGEHCRAPLVRRDVAATARDVDAGRARGSRPPSPQRLGAARVDHEVDAFARERLAQPLPSPLLAAQTIAVLPRMP